ncbi:MAG: four helix bundle protein [Candidatus Cyclobacteriaceae bacterium M2_1C_046]
MGTFKEVEDLEIWQEARALCQSIFVKILDKEEIKDFKLKDQINGSSGSVMDNIAEGLERGGNKEFKQFLSISKGSLGEVKSQLYRAFDRNYLSKKDFDEAFNMTKKLTKKIASLIHYLKRSEFKGNKYNVEELLVTYYSKEPEV